jgi:hypothetical protein
LTLVLVLIKRFVKSASKLILSSQLVKALLEMALVLLLLEFTAVMLKLWVVLVLKSVLDIRGLP